MKKLNVTKWNELRLLVEKDPINGWCQFLGAPGVLPWWENQALTTVWAGKAGDPSVHLRQQATEVLNPTSNRMWRMTVEEAKAVLAILEAGVAGTLTKEEANRKLTLNMNAATEAARLRVPGHVFKTEDFRGGAVDPTTWLYAMRAHYRKVPRLHLRRTLDEQAALLEKALSAAPTLLAGLLLDASEPADSGPSG